MPSFYVACISQVVLGVSALTFRGVTPTFDYALSAGWDFSQGTITKNDLQGSGVLRVGHFAKKGDKILDLEVSCPVYKARKTSANRLRGPFLQINNIPDWQNNYKLKIFETGTNKPVWLERFVFTIWDLDHGHKEKGAEHVNGMEHATVSPVTNYYVHPDTQVNISHDGFKNYTFSATTFGAKPDNPKDPYKVTYFQKTHAVTIEMINITEFEIHFEVFDGFAGRNLLLSGDSALLRETPMPTPTPTPPPTNADDGSCTGYGDPHITSFDGVHYTAFRVDLGAKQGETGEVWLVKSGAVHIQGRFLPSKEGSAFPVITALAVGGPFLSGNTLVVRPVDAGSIKWNGKSVLHEDGSDFAREELHIGGETTATLVTVTSDPNLPSVAPRHFPKQQRLFMEFPFGIRIQVDRNLKTIAFKIIMPPLRGGQDGQCGNFNGQSADDAKSEIEHRIDCHVTKADSMFH